MASVRSSIANLTKTIIGAGLLAIPFAFKQDGILLALLLVFLAGLASAYGLYILSAVADTIPRGQASFTALCEITYPQLSLLFDLSVAIQTFGGALSYLVLVGDLVPSLTGCSRTVAILASLVVILPLVSLRKLDSLRYGSIVGLIAIGFLVLLVVAHCGLDDWSKTQGDLKIIRSGTLPQILSSFSIIVFAYTASQNMCSIINEIDDKTRLNVVIIVSNLIAGVLFILVGLSGYLQYGDNVLGNIILNYNPDLLSSKVGKFALVLMISLSYPLMFHPCRISINNMAYWLTKHIFAPSSTSSTMTETTSLLPDDQELVKDKTIPFPRKNFVLVTIILIFASYGLALSISSFELILSLVGATGSTLICFILPGLFGFKLFQDKLRKNSSLGLTIFGLLIMVTSVYSTLYY